MVVVAVGNAPENFNRLFSFVDRFAGRHSLEAFFQLGYSNFLPQNATSQKFLSNAELSVLFAKASAVIIHGGSGLFEMAAIAGKLPIVCPRLVELGEHTDPSQPEFVGYLLDRDLCIEMTCDETDKQFIGMMKQARNRSISFDQDRFSKAVKQLIYPK